MLAEHIILHMDYLMHLPHVYNEYICLEQTMEASLLSTSISMSTCTGIVL